MAPRRGMKIVGIILLVLVVLLSLGITFTIGWRPIIGAKKRALTDRKFDVTPARLERGRYLVDGVNGCFGCHTDQDWSRPGAPPLSGREGSGHVWADQDLPWLVAPNITPDKETGAGNWSDDALARAIRDLHLRRFDPARHFQRQAGHRAGRLRGSRQTFCWANV